MSEEKFIISHSEVTSFGECTRQHWYNYVLNLRLRRIPDYLQYGIIGHEMLEAYYTVVKNKGSHLEAYEMAFKKLDELRNADRIEDHLAPILELHMQYYFQKYRTLNWEILEVEKKIIVPLDDKPYNYGCRLDLIALFKDGLRRGQIGVIDHKFIHNFYSPSEMLLNVQLPRYVWAARKDGYEIDFGMLAQIRYRTFKDYTKADLFKHEPWNPIPARMENCMQEFCLTADDIYERKKLTKLEALAKTKRVLSPRLVCKYCDFKVPCNASLNGQPEKLLLQSNYEKSTYGYNTLG